MPAPRDKINRTPPTAVGGMWRTIVATLTVALSFSASDYTFAQGIMVNPNGTLSNTRNNGTFSTVVNPGGAPATMHNFGTFSTIINPDGTASTAFHTGVISTVVNADGTHSVLIQNGNTYTLIPAVRPSENTRSFDSDEDSIQVRRVVKVRTMKPERDKKPRKFFGRKTRKVNSSK